LALPEGWQVAPEPDAAVRANVIGAFLWGTDTLVAANGASYFTANGARYGWNPGDLFYSSGWLQQNSNEYKAGCNGRILIYQTSTLTTTSATRTSTSATRTSTSATRTSTSTTRTTTLTENPERRLISSLAFMNVGLWTGGILVFHLVLLGVPVALFARFRTPGLDRE